MKKITLTGVLTGALLFTGCAGVASIENAASQLNAAIPAPNDVDYFAKNSIRNGCSRGMTKVECDQVKEMQLVNKFVNNVNRHKAQALALPVNETNKGHMRGWLNGYDELQNMATSQYSIKQLESIASVMDEIEMKFFMN